jgi:putative spermidine/putrescine transport system permease protein
MTVNWERWPALVGRGLLYAICALILLFLVAPILVVIPLSFNAEPSFIFTPGMLRLDAQAYSTRWYEVVLRDPVWLQSIRNSLLLAVLSTLLATTLGTMAALGLNSARMPAKGLITSILISPMIVPPIVAATGMYFFYSRLDLTQTMTGLVVAHTLLGSPFVVVTVLATLSNFDGNLTRAAATLGANPAQTFLKVVLPLIAPGVLSGAVFAFATSLDELIVVLFLGSVDQRTIPRQMWSGIRENVSPAILAMATILIAVSLTLMIALEVLRRRADRRGASVSAPANE